MRRRGPGPGRGGGRAVRRTRRRARRVRRRRVMLVGGLVAFGAYKFSTRDAKRIEDHTGMDPEEMTDEELEAAMNDLGIEKQMRTANDVEEGAAPAAQGAAPAPAAHDPLDDIERLAELRDQGILTEEEFTAKKRQILGL